MSSVDHPCELFVFVPGSGSGGSSQYELDPVCVRMAVSQLLGVGILVGALGLKLPQVMTRRYPFISSISPSSFLISILATVFSIFRSLRLSPRRLSPD